MEEKSSKQNPSSPPEILLKGVMAKYVCGKTVCCWQEGIFYVTSKQIRYRVWWVVCPCLFSYSQCFGLLVAEGGVFFLQILFAFFYLSKVLLEARGRGSQTPRTSRKGQIKMAFLHLGSSSVLEKTVYSQMCLFWFLSFLLCIDIQDTLRRWTFLFTGEIQ